MHQEDWEVVNRKALMVIWLSLSWKDASIILVEMSSQELLVEFEMCLMAGHFISKEVFRVDESRRYFSVRAESYVEAMLIDDEELEGRMKEELSTIKAKSRKHRSKLRSSHKDKCFNCGRIR